jgi:hypothetical protein
VLPKPPDGATVDGVTVTVDWAVAEPAEFWAVKVYVVVMPGVTVVVMPRTLPIVVRDTLGAGLPVTVHAMVLPSPATMLAGVAVNEVIAGGVEVG